MSEVRLMLGDCLELMRDLPAGSVDAIITDLPYGTTACAWDEVIPFAPMWAEVKQVLKPRGVFVTTASQPFTSKLVASNLDWFRCEWVWNKEYCTGHLNANRAPMKQHENIVVFALGAHTYNPQMERLSDGDYRIRKNGRGREKVVDSVYQCKALKHHKETGTRYPKSIVGFHISRCDTVHPTQKPVALYEYLIKTYTNEGETVLDICMGSGTTGCAAVNTGRSFVGMELRADYYEIAQRRITEAQAQMRMPL